jgi:Tfp pilus assembly protein PilX
MRITCRQKASPGNTGAILPAVVLLTLAGTLLGLSALRSAHTETRLGASLQAARNAFMLAELGIESGMKRVIENPALLQATAASELMQSEIDGKGRVHAVLHRGVTDDHCPNLVTGSAIRTHYEIHATGIADRGALTTHVLGFHVCTETCTSIYCVAAESLPVRSYWSAAPGLKPSPTG